MPETKLDQFIDYGLNALGGWLQKAFKLGAQVLPSDEGWGIDPTKYSPEEYGNYLATSVPIYACAQLRAKNLAKLPLRLWKLDLRGNKTEVTKGKAFELLTKVNPFWGWGRLVRMTELARCLWGVSYWCLERGQGGKQVPAEIWWARPDRMRVLPHRTEYVSGFIYEALGERVPFARQEVVWLPLDNPIDEFSGLSPLAAARLSADLGTAALRSNKKLFDQGMQLGGVVGPKEGGAMWTQEQVTQVEGMLRRKFQSVENAHRWAVFSGAVTATPLGVNPRDAEFVGQMRWSLGDVGRVYNIAPELLGDNEHATYNNVESAWKQLWSDCIIPEAVDIAEVITEQLLSMFPGEADMVEFDTSGIAALQEDRKEIVDQMHKLWQMQVPLNRLLQEFQPNLLPETGDGYPWGDVGYMPNTLVPVGTPAEPPPTSVAEGMERALAKLKELKEAGGPATGQPLLPEAKAVEEMAYGSAEHELAWRKFARRTERHEERFGELVADLFRRQKESVLARLRGRVEAGMFAGGNGHRAGMVVKADAEDEPFDLAQWGKTFKAEGMPVLRAIIADAGESTIEDLNLTVDFDLTNPEFVRFLERSSQRFAREVNDTTWQKLKDSLSEGIKAGESIPELAERVEQVMGDRIRSSKTVIARTEVHRATVGGGLISAKASGVVKRKGWLTSLDGRARDTHKAAHGQTVGIDEDFHVGAGKGPAPGHIGIAAEDVDCRCALTWLLN